MVGDSSKVRLSFYFQSYLKKYQFGNAKTEDLWTSLTEVSSVCNDVLVLINLFYDCFSVIFLVKVTCGILTV